MAWWGKVIGSVAGLAVGGPLGALLGAAAGHTVDQAHAPWRSPLRPGQRLRLDALVDSGFALMGHIAKADGRVSQAEIAVAEAWMRRLALTSAQRQRAMERFEAGKQAEFSVARTVGQLRLEVGMDVRLLHTLLEMQVGIATADGRPSAAARLALSEVLSRLGLPAAVLDAMLGQPGFTAGSRRRTASAVPGLEQDYRLLGVPVGAEAAAIKRAYRRLISRHHPDKVGDTAGATATAQAINEAYRRIREARRF